MDNLESWRQRSAAAARATAQPSFWVALGLDLIALAYFAHSIVGAV